MVSKYIIVDYFTIHTVDLEYDSIEPRMCYIIFADSRKIPAIEDISEAQKGEDISIYTKKKGYYLKDGIIFYRCKLYVPPTIKQCIIRSCHNAYTIGHAGQKKTATLITRVMS